MPKSSTASKMDLTTSISTVTYDLGPNKLSVVSKTATSIPSYSSEASYLNVKYPEFVGSKLNPSPAMFSEKASTVAIGTNENKLTSSIEVP